MVGCLATYTAQLAVLNDLSLPELGITVKSTGGLKQLTEFADDPNAVDSGDSDSEESTDSKEDDPLRRSTRISRRPSLTLAKLTLRLTDATTISTLVERQAAFFEFVSSLSVQILKNNSPIQGKFTSDQALELTNLFFDKMMGHSGLHHVQSLIKYYTDGRKNGVDMGLAMRAEKMAGEDHRPREFREFYGAVAKQQQLQHNSSTLFSQLLLNVHNLDVIQRLAVLQHAVNSKSARIIRHLEDEGETVAQGRGWGDCLMSLIRRQMGLAPNAFSNLKQEARGAQGLVLEFGSGILCLLPKGGAYRYMIVTPPHRLLMLTVLD